MWFQPDLPNPAVDLSKIGFDNYKDKYPVEHDALIDDYEKNWLNKKNLNFSDSSYTRDWFFNELYFKDQYEQAHLPMTFLSKISSPCAF